MKKAINVFLSVLKWILALLLFLFSMATLLGHSYLQTLLLWISVASILIWPGYIQKKWNRRASRALRWTTASLFLLLSLVLFKPEPKSSVYISEECREELMYLYDKMVARWPEGTEDIAIKTSYGKVHALACGNTDHPPLVMIHAASMGAQSWLFNLEPLLDHYRIYSIDNIGEGNKSELADPLIFPQNQEQIADHFAEIMEALGIKKTPLFGASNGGFIAMCYASYYPERVESLSLFGPMGLTQLTGKSITMLSIATMYPFQFVRDRVASWALGNADVVNNAFGEWFNCMLEGTIPSVGMPVPMTRDQKSAMTLPVLLFLGTEDPIVGDAEKARQTAEEFANIRIEVLESGHLIATEHATYVNSVVENFLGIE